MAKSQPKKRISKNSGSYLRMVLRWLGFEPIRNSTSRKIVIGLAVLAMLILASNFLPAMWYKNKHKDEPLVFGTTFIPSYAEFYGLDPEETMDALIDLGFERFRLVSYWDQIEKTEGTYDFSGLDWQFAKAEEARVDVSLALGLRQPRWPECHMPKWAMTMQKDEWQPKLNTFITVVMDRYKNSPSLVSYQLENEFFMSIFGECTDFDRNRLVSEFELAKMTDPTHPIIISRSNNWGGVPLRDPTPDQFAISVYKRVWDKTITKRYFEYPYPAWFYGGLAGAGEIVSGKDMFVHELQMEPWLPESKGFSMNDVSSVPEQNKSMNAERLAQRFDYGEATGMRTLDTWGGEWWYWRKTVADDPSLWNTARQKLQEARDKNQQN